MGPHRHQPPSQSKENHQHRNRWKWYCQTLRTLKKWLESRWRWLETVQRRSHRTHRKSSSHLINRGYGKLLGKMITLYIIYANFCLIINPKISFHISFLSFSNFSPVISFCRIKSQKFQSSFSQLSTSLLSSSVVLSMRLYSGLTNLSHYVQPGFYCLRVLYS